MSLWLLVAFCLAARAVGAGPLSEAKPEDVGMSSQRLDRLSQTMQRTVDSGEPGTTENYCAISYISR